MFERIVHWLIFLSIIGYIVGGLYGLIFHGQLPISDGFTNSAY